MIRKVIASLVTIIVFISCTNNQIEVSELTKSVIKTKYKISWDSTFFKDACTRCLSIINSFKLDNSDCFAFLDFHPGVVYLYDATKKKNICKFKIPRECSFANVFYIKNIDSIYYINRQKYCLVLADTVKIKKQIDFSLSSIDSNYVALPLQSKLLEYKNSWLFGIYRLCYSATFKNYYRDLNRSPIFAYYDNANQKLDVVKLKRQILVQNDKEMVSNSVVCCVNEKQNKLIFSYKCSDTLYIYDFISKELDKIKYKNTPFTFEPIFYAQDPQKPNLFYEIANKQSSCNSMFYSSKLNCYFREISYIKNEKKTKIMQIINTNFKLIRQYTLPDDLIEISEINGSVFMHRIDGNKNLIYEEFYNIN